MLISTQHQTAWSPSSLRRCGRTSSPRCCRGALRPVRLSGHFYCNPTGRFVIGGPVGDAGLTGRKIIVDTYGGFARHGGGAFSGKDPSKVDRSAAYAARYVAKNIVAAGLADRAEVQVAYAIGVARPLSLLVETFGTEKISRESIAELVSENFDLRPGAILGDLELHRPVYQPTAAYGHFGRPETPSPGSAPTRPTSSPPRPAWVKPPCRPTRFGVIQKQRPAVQLHGRALAIWVGLTPRIVPTNLANVCDRERKFVTGGRIGEPWVWGLGRLLPVMPRANVTSS